MIIESLSGVRAHDKDMSDVFLKAYAAAFVAKVGASRIVVGRDTRKSGERIMDTIIEGIRNAGAKVINIGICPTPTVQYATYYHQAQGGISITASHNPLPWNGLKFINGDGEFLNAEAMKELQESRMEFERKLPLAPAELPEIIEAKDAVDHHVTDVLNLHYINLEKIREKKFKVVFDAVNGAAFEAGPKLLESLGCEVVAINCDGKKDFPRTPEPTQENLKELEEAVKKNNADIGFAVDPDGDRLAIVDEKGRAASEEVTLVMAAKIMLQRVISVDKEIVTNLSTTMALDKIAQQYGGKVTRTPVGEINVVEELHAGEGILGGEGNGGIILPYTNRGRDSLAGMALILYLLVFENKTVSEIMDTIPTYVMVKKKIETTIADLDNELEKLEEIKEPEDVDDRDGLKLIFENSWVHIRKSNTEPIVRVIAEAPTREEAEVLASKFVNYFK
ncbi:MAG: phosphoglucosamine mutase [Candidatus Marinimicrobia bacterium]|nr:phosphoglucosamine mutase [Candidatus Neomarinimicrobiota bacterium]